MFDSKTASEGVLRAYVVVVVAARAKSVVPRTRMVCRAKVVIPPVLISTRLASNFVGAFQSRTCYVVLTTV